MLLMFDEKHKKHLAFLLDIDMTGKYLLYFPFVIRFRDTKYNDFQKTSELLLC